jgi:hypothetical protein
MAKTLKLTNDMLDILVEATSISLPFERSRIRNEFVKSIKPFVEIREKARVEMLEKFSEKDDKGVCKIERGNYKIIEDKREELNKEYKELMDKEVIIEIPIAVEKSLGVIRDIIVNNPNPLEPKESLDLVKIVELIEAIK